MKRILVLALVLLSAMTFVFANASGESTYPSQSIELARPDVPPLHEGRKAESTL